MGQIIVGAKLDWGAGGGAFAARTAVTVGITTYVAIPAGWWYVETDAHTTVVGCYDIVTNSGPGGSSHNIVLCAISSVRLVYSDGFSVFFLGDGTGGTGQQTQIKAAE
jgi:hypothetical protein